MPYYFEDEFEFIYERKKRARTIMKLADNAPCNPKIRKMIRQHAFVPHYHAGEWMGLGETSQGVIVQLSRPVQLQMAQMILEGEFSPPGKQKDPDSGAGGQDVTENTP